MKIQNKIKGNFNLLITDNLDKYNENLKLYINAVIVNKLSSPTFVFVAVVLGYISTYYIIVIPVIGLLYYINYENVKYVKSHFNKKNILSYRREKLHMKLFRNFYIMGFLTHLYMISIS
jgi:maltodextrin utilization protein YvdJ